MKKRLVSLMLAGLLTLSLTACGGQKSDSPATSGNGDAAPSGTIVLKCGHVLADGSHFDFGVDKFAELVNEKSGGTLQVEVHTDGTLGQEREMMESLQIGNLDLALVSTAPISNFYSQMSVLDMPYLFDSKAHAYAVLDGEIGQSLFDGLESQGMVGLTYMENGFRNVFSTNAVAKIDYEIDRRTDREINRVWYGEEYCKSFDEGYINGAVKALAEVIKNYGISLNDSCLQNEADSLNLSLGELRERLDAKLKEMEHPEEK